MKKFLLALLLLTSPALAQQVRQSGNVTPGHVPMWSTTGVIRDGGTAFQGFLTTLGVTANGPGICQNSAPITQPYNRLCFGVSTSSNAQITLQNLGGATAQSLEFVINGVVVPLGGGGGSPGGSSTQVQFNNSGTFGGIANATSDGTTLALNNGFKLTGSSSGTITIGAQAAAGTYNLNLPTNEGVSGQVLTSGGGGSTPMTWTDAATPTLGTAGYALTGNGASVATFQGFTQTGTGASTRTWQSKAADTVYAQDFGALGDGTTNDSNAIINAAAQCNANGGGQIYLKPTGHAYLLNTGITLANGCMLVGAGTKVYPGSTATIAQWTQAGSWVQCADPVNPCVSAANSGSGVANINFIHAQPIPSGGSWTPTTWPYTIAVSGTMFTLKNIVSVGDSHGVNVDFSSGGSYSVIEDVYVSGYVIGFRVDNVNDIVRVNNFHCRNLYYESDSRVYTYMINNSICNDVHYWDNPFISGFECFLVAICQQFTNSTVLGETHSFWNAQVDNLQCNLVPACAKVTAAATRVQAEYTNTLVQSEDTLIGTAANYAFDFTTNDVHVVFNGLIVNDVGRGVMTLGNAGTGAVAQINGLQVRQYSGLTAGNVAFNTTANANLYLPTGSLNITGSVSPLAGAIFAGAGTVFTVPNPTATLNGGVKAVTCGAGQFVNVIAATPTCATPGGGGGIVSTALGGLGADNSASTGVPLFASGTVTITATTGTGSFARATSPTFVTPVLGTPTSVTLTNATGLPVSTGISGLGTGIATWLGTPSSANLAAALTDETGSGAAVFATSPTLVTPVLGTPTSGTLTNATGLPIATGVSGLGSGVATLLASASSGSGGPAGTTSASLTTPALSAETFSTASTVTAGTNAQGQGALTSDYNVITTAASNPSGATLPTATQGRRVIVVNKGANAVNIYPASGGTIDALSANAAISLPVSGIMQFNASSTTQWYSTSNGTTAAGAITGTLAVANGGTGVTTSTGTTNVVLSNSPTLVTPALGTPSSATLTNATGLPISTGVSGLGTGVATFLATPSSANLASALTDEVGTGNALFGVTTTAWTPALTFGGGSTSLTYSSRQGDYVKMGTFVYAIFDIRLSAKGSSTGNVAITGLPVTIATINAQGTVTFYQNLASITGPLTLSGSTSGTSIDFVSIGGSASIAQATEANFTNTSIIVGWVGYFI